jgi:hypothetical protein
LAPNLYKQAWFKHRTVNKELQRLNWIKTIRNIDLEQLLDEFVLLFRTLEEIHLTKEKDSIYWRWITSGEYSDASASEVQFMGAYPLLRASTVWQAKAEPRCLLFAWLAIQGKAPTTNILAKKN